MERFFNKSWQFYGNILSGILMLFFLLFYNSKYLKWIFFVSAFILLFASRYKKQFDKFESDLLQFYAESMGIAVMSGGLVLLGQTHPDKNAIPIVIAGFIMFSTGIYFSARVRNNPRGLMQRNPQ